MWGGKQGCVGETGLCGEVSKIVWGNGAVWGGNKIVQGNGAVRGGNKVVRGGRQGCVGRRAGNNHLLSVGLDMNCC